MRPISPSVAFGCIELVAIVARNQVVPGGVDSLSLGAVPARDILEAAIELGWLAIAQEGILRLSAKGEKALASTSPLAKLRLLVLDYVDIKSPPWMQLAAAGRQDVLMHAPKELCQVFVEAGLAYGYDPETVAFWDAMAAKVRGARNASMTETGRIGERLTLAHEETRTGEKAKWVALDDNSSGYDVLSRVGRGDTRRLTIEVKTSTMDIHRAQFHVTRNEWDTAKDSLNHVFHLWDVFADIPRLAVLRTEDVQPHVPANSGDGIWENFFVPFLAFENLFTISSN